MTKKIIFTVAGLLVILGAIAVIKVLQIKTLINAKYTPPLESVSTASAKEVGPSGGGRATMRNVRGNYMVRTPRASLPASMSSMIARKPSSGRVSVTSSSSMIFPSR